MSQVNQIIDDILHENNLDWDHPVVPYLRGDIINELSNRAIHDYRQGAKKFRSNFEKNGGMKKDYGRPDNATGMSNTKRYVNRLRGLGKSSDRFAVRKGQWVDPKSKLHGIPGYQPKV